MPRFPESSIRTAIELVATYPRVSVARIVQRIFPYKLVDLTQQSIPALNLACSRFFTDTNIEFELVSIVKTQENQATCTLRSVELRGQAAPQVTHTQQLVASKNDLTTNTIACGRGIPMLRASTPSCELHYHRRIVAEAIMDQSIGADICLVRYPFSISWLGETLYETDAFNLWLWLWRIASDWRAWNWKDGIGWKAGDLARLRHLGRDHASLQGHVGSRFATTPNDLEHR